MSLPGIIAPPGTPVFLAEGHQIAEDSVFAQVNFRSGHARSRRARTVPERVVSVSWFLEADQLADVESWFENDLQAGALQFAARVANQGPGLLYWTARWIEFQTQMLPLGRGLVTGTLLLTGEGSETGPDLSELAAEVSVALAGAATATIPNELAAEVVIALVANSANTLLQAEASIALDGEAAIEETLLLAEVSIALDGAADATVTAGACAPFAVLGDTGITISTGGTIAAITDTGETLDACRDLT